MERSEEQPDALCVAFDLHAPTFRHLRYDGYKATRHPMPEELAMQMPVMKQVLAAMNIPVYACEGWEADDVLGTVGRLCEEAGWDCAILTGDATACSSSTSTSPCAWCARRAGRRGRSAIRRTSSARNTGWSRSASST